MAVFDTRRTGARGCGAALPKGPPHASQPLIRVAGGVGATLGWEVCGPGGERARVSQWRFLTRAGGGVRRAPSRGRHSPTPPGVVNHGITVERGHVVPGEEDFAALGASDRGASRGRRAG
eukprot:scaffold36295_cov126-Isochrysis_galbana.AAC.1